MKINTKYIAAFTLVALFAPHTCHTFSNPYASDNTLIHRAAWYGTAAGTDAILWAFAKKERSDKEITFKEYLEKLKENKNETIKEYPITSLNVALTTGTGIFGIYDISSYGWKTLKKDYDKRKQEELAKNSNRPHVKFIDEDGTTPLSINIETRSAQQPALVREEKAIAKWQSMLTALRIKHPEIQKTEAPVKLPTSTKPELELEPELDETSVTALAKEFTADILKDVLQETVDTTANKKDDAAYDNPWRTDELEELLSEYSDSVDAKPIDEDRSALIVTHGKTQPSTETCPQFQLQIPAPERSDLVDEFIRTQYREAMAIEQQMKQRAEELERAEKDKQPETPVAPAEEKSLRTGLLSIAQRSPRSPALSPKSDTATLADLAQMKLAEKHPAQRQENFATRLNREAKERRATYDAKLQKMRDEAKQKTKQVEATQARMDATLARYATPLNPEDEDFLNQMEANIAEQSK